MVIVICLLFVICDLEFLFLHYSTTARNLGRQGQELNSCLEYKERMWARQVTTFCECVFLRRLEVGKRATRNCVRFYLSKSRQSAESDKAVLVHALRTMSGSLSIFITETRKYLLTPFFGFYETNNSEEDCNES